MMFLSHHCFFLSLPLSKSTETLKDSNKIKNKGLCEFTSWPIPLSSVHVAPSGGGQRVGPGRDSPQ